MKSKLVLALALTVVTAACSPDIYRVNLDVRQPSKSGLNLLGKSVGIVYEQGPTPTDSLISANTASAFARELEKDYFNADTLIGLYTIPVQDSISVQTLRDLIMDTGEDVVFVMKSTTQAPDANGLIPYRMRLWAYDSMGDDSLLDFTGRTTLKSVDQDTSNSLAKLIAPRFKSEWKTESFSFYWFDDMQADQWISALDKIERGDFPGAIKVWESFVKNKNRQKAACASYNIAMGFYLLGEMTLAGRWLDMAEKLENVPLAQALRKRIASHLEK
ncbi:MAG: hypothetical protein J5835_00605 [Bacteroidales bacterium]|nr:hypothetical protein [Bacteroidales bacterium]